jgi:hypothetical protein
MVGIVSTVSDTLPIDLISQVGQIGLWLQALGVVIILTIIFQIIIFILNGKKLREIHLIKQDMARIEGKVDVLLSMLSRSRLASQKR